MKSLFTSIKERIGLLSLVIIVLVVIMLITFSVSTRWILTTKKINTTDAYNLTIEIDGIYSYPYKDYIPKTNDFEYVNYQIPKNSFELEKAFLLIFLVIVLVFLLTKKKERLDIASKKEIEREAKNECERLKGERKIKNYQILTQGALKQVQVGSDEPKPVLWMIPSEYTMPDDTSEHHLLMFNPITRLLCEDRKLEEEFTGEDRCYNCGMYSDFKVIRPSDLKLLDEVFGWTKGWGKR